MNKFRTLPKEPPPPITRSIRTWLTWKILKLLCRVLNTDRDRPIVIVFTGDATVEMQQSGSEKIMKQFN